MDKPTLEVRNLVKRFRNGVIAVTGLDMEVCPGQVLGLAGPNGSGKSVTMKILMGLIRPTAGSVSLLGEEVRSGGNALGRVGMLIDGPGFIPHLSGLTNLQLAAATCGRKVSSTDFEEAIELAALGKMIDRPYKTYSHGMRYRLGLARALLGHPEVLLLDEAATGLDPVQGRAVREKVVEAAEDGASVVYAAHQLYEVEQICTHVVIMQKGRQVISGSLHSILPPDGSTNLEQVYIDAVNGSRLGGGLGAEI